MKKGLEKLMPNNKEEKLKWEEETVKAATDNSRFVGTPGSEGRVAISITSPENFCKQAADKVASRIGELQEDPQKQVTMVLDRGNTMRDILAGLIKRDDIDWKRIHVFQLHEFKGLPPTHKFSFAYFLA